MWPAGWIASWRDRHKIKTDPFFLPVMTLRELQKSKRPWISALRDPRPAPLAGGFPTRICYDFVALGSSFYDIFPSLHILMTCVLGDFDGRETRWRFWIMILPAIGLGASTLYLRYHYAIDLLAGFGIFLLLRVWASRQWPRHQAMALAVA